MGLGRRGVHGFLGDVRALYADHEGRRALQQVDETLDRITHGLAARARSIAADLVALLGECMSLDDRVEQALARGRHGQHQAGAFHGVKRRAAVPRAVLLEQAISEIDEDADDVASRSLLADDLVRLAWASSDLARAAKALQWLARHIAGLTPRQRRNLDWGADSRNRETLAHGRAPSHRATIGETRRSARARLQVDLAHEELRPASPQGR